MTLYTYARDVKPGVSACIEQCSTTWPPYLADDKAEATGDFTLIAREDGTTQWAYENKPLYRYSVDESPGDTYGEGVQALWSLAFVPIDTPPGIEIEKTLLGYVAANSLRKTLYVPEGSVDPQTICLEGSCGRDWTPLIAPWAARAMGDWSVVERTDGIRQWAYRGQPLFSFADDVHPTETRGDGESFGAIGVARAMVLEPRPPYPDWISVQTTDAGTMLANEEGKTVYTYDPTRVPFYIKNPPKACELDCAPEWVPILADADDTATGGNWAIVELSTGDRQWAYKGKRLYTNTRDRTQGSFLGYRHGGDRAWNVIMHNEQALVGTLRPP